MQEKWKKKKSGGFFLHPILQIKRGKNSPYMDISTYMDI